MPSLTLDRVVFLIACFLLTQNWNDLRKRVETLEREKLGPTALELIQSEFKHVRELLDELKSDFKACAACKVAE